MFLRVHLFLSWILFLSSCSPHLGQDHSQSQDQFQSCVGALNRDDVRQAIQKTYSLLSLDGETASKGSAYYLAGWIHQYREALGDKTEFNYDRFLKNYPQHTLAAVTRENAADNWLLKGDYHKARIEYSRLEEYFPELINMDEILFKTAQSQYHQREISDCMVTLQKLMKRYPKSEIVPAGIYLWALCYEKKGDKQKASETLRRLAEGYSKSGYATREIPFSQVK